MVSYSVAPADVRAVLARTASDGLSLADAYNGFGPALDSASAASGSTGHIAGALTQVTSYLGHSERVAGELVDACVGAAVQALTAYLDADQQMAVEYTEQNLDPETLQEIPEAGF